MPEPDETVVLVHSSAGSSRQWRALIERLQPRYRVMAPDLTGYGARDTEPGSFDLDRERLRAIMDGAAGPVHLVGHSYGGLLALDAAFAEPGRIRSLTVIEPVCFHLLEEAGETDALDEIAAVRDRQVEAVERGDLEASARGFLGYWMGPEAWSGISEARRAAMAGLMPKVMAEWPGAFGRTTRLSQYRALDDRALVMRAADTTLAARTVVDLIGARAGDPAFIEIASGGHMAPVTNPEPVNAAIESFLDGLETRA